MSLNHWFQKGITSKQYEESLDKHREHYFHIYNQFQIPKDDVTFLKDKSKYRIIAIAEPWCGHCMMDVPIMLRIAEAADMEVSILPRDEHLELMDQYTVDGKRYIPIFIFIDNAGNELGKWGPMAPEVRSLVDDGKKAANLPDKEDPHYKDLFSEYASKLTNTFANDTSVWSKVYEDIKKSLP